MQLRTEMLNPLSWLKPALGAIAALSLAACETFLPVASIEQAIQSDLTQRGQLSLKSIACPTTVKPEPGKSFDCIGELDTGGLFFITVIQEDDRGKVRWEVPNSWSLLNLNQLEAEFGQTLKAQTKRDLSVNCSGVYRPTKPGDSFECQLVQPKIKKQSPPSTVLVRVEPEGKVTWQEVRIVAAPPRKTLTTGNLAPAVAAQSNKAATSTANLPPQVGVKDETGWTELAD